MPGRMKAPIVMCLVCLASTLGLGWVTFVAGAHTFLLDLAFWASVGGFVVCCLWLFARGLAPIQRSGMGHDESFAQHRPPHGPDSGGSHGHDPHKPHPDGDARESSVSENLRSEARR
jgi:hypothetical protein